MFSIRAVGRYQVYEAFAAGGMAAVHFGRLQGHAGFARIVAIKQLHASFAEDATTVSTLLDEARLASRIQHPNVVGTLDVVVEGADIFLVLEYVQGESLARLLRKQAPPVPVATSILAGALHGLHAAHEAKAESGESLGIVHRDVSPHNILVGVDGLARVLDFGIAKARGRLQTTREGQVKGKLAYMAPEQIKRGEVNRRTDVFAAGIVLWETLTGTRLFTGENEGHVITNLLERVVPPPSSLRPGISDALDAIVLRALERDPEARFATAREFALSLDRCGLASPATVGHWVEEAARDVLETRAARVGEIERSMTERPPKPAASDEPTATATVSSESDATENRALALEPPVRKSGVLVALGGAALAVTIAAWATLGSTDGPAASQIPEPEVSSAPATPVQQPRSAETPPAPTPTASAASTARKHFPRTGAPPAPPPPLAPSASASASAKPFYRFE
ncbi:MAG TPA: serine/threonine-protein kinase [Polyangiaceae bacterium]|nr:serine/threonine-protein kinase [Polyangiaceae bacterium]